MSVRHIRLILRVGKGNTDMQRIGLFCTAFAISALAGPVAAQQFTSDEQPTASEQPQQTQPPPLPPFPPMPHHAVRSSRQATPHEHYPGSSEHRTTSAKHHTTTHHKSTYEHHPSYHHATSHHTAHEHHHAVHLSKRTIGQCHKMSYKEIMRYPNCRALMMQDLEEHEHRQASKHHKTSHVSTKHHLAKHHATTHRHGTTHHH